MPYWVVPDYAALLEGIEAACQRGAARALEMRATMANEIKPDGSIVTDADREVSRLRSRFTPVYGNW